MRAVSFAPGSVRILLALAIGTNACDGCKEPSSTADADTREPAVPAPPGVLAEITIATPDATWGRLQRGVGGLTALMAPTLGGVLASVAGLDPDLSNEIDGSSPAYGVLPETKNVIVAMHVRNPTRIKDALAGDGGKYKAEDHAGFAVIDKGDVAIGLAPSGWLVVGKTKDDVAKFGPYTYRTLPTRPLPRSNIHVDLARDAFGAIAKSSLEPQWKDLSKFLLEKNDEMKKKHDGRDADFGDAEQIVSVIDGFVKERIDVISDLGTGMLDLDVRDDQMTGALAIEPGAGASKKFVDGMRPGPMKIGSFPGDTSVLVVLRDDKAGRESSMHALSAGLQKALGKRLSESDAKKMDDALLAWAAAHGDWIGVGLAGKGLFMRTPANGDAQKSMRDLVALAERPAFKNPLESGFRLKNLTYADVLFGSDKGTVATMTHETKEESVLPPKVGIGWVTRGENIDIAIGGSPETLAGSANDDGWDRAIAKVGSDASFVLAAHFGLGDPVSSIAVMRKDGKISVALDLAPRFARQILGVLTSR